MLGNNSYLTELDPTQPNPWVNPTHGHVWSPLLTVAQYLQPNYVANALFTLRQLGFLIVILFPRYNDCCYYNQQPCWVNGVWSSNGHHQVTFEVCELSDRV